MSTRSTNTSAVDGVTDNSDGGVRFDIGDFVVDKNDDEDTRDVARVINIPGVQAKNWDAYQTENGEQLTVADTNPEYTPTTPVIVCLFTSQIQANYPDWNGDNPLNLKQVTEDNVTHYAFPAERLRPVEQLDDNPLEPPEELVQLAANLESGATVTLERQGTEHELLIEKLGIEYQITEHGEVIGEGPHKDPFSKKVDKFL